MITGDYTAAATWARRPLVAGTPVGKPTPVFTKLDPSVVDEELARLTDRPGPERWCCTRRPARR